MSLYLVRHGRPLIVVERPAHTWELDPAGYDDIWALRTSGRLPQQATWYSSPEPKAQQTAQLLTDGQVGVVPDLRELERPAGWSERWEEDVRRCFAQPEEPACPGWESLADCRRRVHRAVTPILTAHGGESVVLVGHGTAWSALISALNRAAPDLALWQRLGMPDLIVWNG